MRASEFITEQAGKMAHHQHMPMKGSELVRDGDHLDRIYHMNRFMMAMASADGRSHKPVDMDESSWTEKYNTIHPYTEEEHNMVKQAMATVKTDHISALKDHSSLEPDDVYRVSPVKGFKGY